MKFLNVKLIWELSAWTDNHVTSHTMLILKHNEWWDMTTTLYNQLYNFNKNTKMCFASHKLAPWYDLSVFSTIYSLWNWYFGYRIRFIIVIWLWWIFLFKTGFKDQIKYCLIFVIFLYLFLDTPAQIKW